MSEEVRASSFDVVSVGTSAKLLIPENGTRRGLMISGPLVNRVTISPRSGVTDGAGIVLFPGTVPLVLCCCDVGDWIRKELWGITNAGSETIAYTEAYD